jgi:hypothetical protein
VTLIFPSAFLVTPICTNPCTLALAANVWIDRSDLSVHNWSCIAKNGYPPPMAWVPLLLVDFAISWHGELGKAIGLVSSPGLRRSVIEVDDR